MAGRVIRVLKKTTIDFAGIGSGSMTFDVMPPVDVSQFKEATVLLRVHGNQSFPSQTNIVIRVYPWGGTDEDPAARFVGGTALQTITLDGSTVTAVPYFTTASVTSSTMGAMLLFRITGQGSGSGTPKGDIRIDFAGKQ